MLTEAVSGVTAAIDLVKRLLALRDIGKNAEAKLLIAELQLQLASVKTELASALEEKLRLEAELKRATAPPEVVCKDGLYYKSDGDGPFCTTCYDSRGQLIRVTEMAKTFRCIGRWRCGECTAKYN